MDTQENMTLAEFFAAHPRVAVAFSGGADSACLLYAAARYAEKVCAYTVKTAFQPQFELEDAKRAAAELGVPLRVLPVEILRADSVAENPPDRCYHCKRLLFEAIRKAASGDGFPVVLDGTNASDEEGDRPGVRALRELSVYSPLRMCGLTKEDVRRLSREAGLFTWNKPAYACLATRIPAGERITQEKLQRTERAEAYLSSLGFTDFRVRYRSGAAVIQVRESELPLLAEKRRDILEELGKSYQAVLLDLSPRPE